MANDKGVREALMAEMGWSKQILTNRVTRLVKKHGIAPRVDSLYVLAVENDIPLDEYGVDSETQRRASDLARLVRGDGQVGPASLPKSKVKANTNTSRKTTDTALGQVELGALPNFMSKFTAGNHKRSATAYQLLQLIETSVRETIERVLTKKHGIKDWWSAGIDPDIQAKAAARMKDDAADPWHAARGEHEIHYIDLSDYVKIIVGADNWPAFKPIFKRTGFVDETLHQINVSRRVVAHMNPLRKDDFDQLRANYRKWMDMLRANEPSIM